jgi:hypothetical protein
MDDWIGEVPSDRRCLSIQSARERRCPTKPDSGALAVLLMVATATGYFPARRATRAEPSVRFAMDGPLMVR